MRRGLLIILVALLVLVWAGDLGAQSAIPDPLPSKGSTEIPFAFVSGTFGLWSGGRLLVVEHRFSGAPLFRVFDPDGHQTSQFTFTIPEVSRINMYDRSIARGLDGSLAVIGSAYTNDSRGTTFLAWLSSDGQEQTVVRLSPFSPTAVTLAADGTIWVAGHQRTTGPERDYSQNLVRRYDKMGKLLGSFMPWSSLGEVAPRTPSPDMRSILLSTADGIGWYSPHSRTYIEFSLDGKVIYRIQTPEHPREETLGAALCDDGSLFVSASVNNGPNRTASWGIHALDRQRGDWTFIPRPGPWGMLYGCNGTRLASTTNSRTITWLEPAKK